MAATRDRSRYQGRRLAFLLAAMCLPIGVLYLRLVFGLAAGDSRVTAQQAAWLGKLSSLALALFFPVQLAGASYVQRMLPPRQTTLGKVLQYVMVFAMCVLLSLVGAVVLEAFGLNLFLRARH